MTYAPTAVATTTQPETTSSGVVAQPGVTGRLTPPAVTWAEHGDRFVAGVENGPLSATQFHPEKSGDAGAQLLTNWLQSV